MKQLYPLAFSAILISCGGEEKDYVETEYDIDIAKYLEDKDWEPVRTESGLYIYKEIPGSADKPNLESYLTLKYTGYLLDGTVFDGTHGEATTFDFPVSALIGGWQEAIPQFGRGGKGKLIIPPDLGYGDKPAGIIPANAILAFDIEIVDFTNEPPMPVITDFSAAIEEYIATEGIEGMTKTESGLYIKIDEAGSEEKPTLDSYLTLNYEGYLLDGTSFDGTGGTPTTFPFPVSGLIAGWKEGIPKFGKGGHGKLIIPPDLGYGPNDTPTIPGNSILVFDMEIIDFTDEEPQPLR